MTSNPFALGTPEKEIDVVEPEHRARKGRITRVRAKCRSIGIRRARDLEGLACAGKCR